MNKFTDDQQRIIDEMGKNILVSHVSPTLSWAWLAWLDVVGS